MAKQKEMFDKEKEAPGKGATQEPKRGLIVSIRLERATRDKLAILAEQDNRTSANWIENHILKEYKALYKETPKEERPEHWIAP